MADQTPPTREPIKTPLFNQNSEVNAALIEGASRVFAAQIGKDGGGLVAAVAATEKFIETISRLQRP